MILFRLFRFALYGCFYGLLGLLIGCAQTPDGARTDSRLHSSVIVNGGVLPTPAEQYAGEVLAYMMRVTLGKAGNPKLREEWGDRGLNLPLDFGAIADMMQGPEKDPRRVMVLDNNILGLSRVLYHYDKRLNLFKVRGGQESVFPCTELVSIRVMLLQKMDRGEKVSMAALMDKKEQLLDSRVTAGQIDLGDTNLQASEMKLIKDVIQSKPSFMTYLEDPFVVDMLYRIGAVSMDTYVREKIQSARYSAFALEQGQKRNDKKSVQVTILPSIVKSFVHRSIDTDAYPNGFMPEETYTEIIETFQNVMIGLLQKLVMTQMFGDLVTKDSDEQKRRDVRVKEFIETHLDVRSIKQRPLVIYPENADRVIQDVCPDSDFNVIVLGKNVYLSMQMLAVDTYPHVNRMYLDIVDIRHGQVNYEISQISMFVFNRLKPLISSIGGS